VKIRIAYLVLVVIPRVGFPLLAGEIFFRRPKRVPSRRNIDLIQSFEHELSQSADSGIEGE
jgi:hypothetical protein